jgi:prepilin-type N-terminal cleavage/methylation domain-containing protein
MINIRAFTLLATSSVGRTRTSAQPSNHSDFGPGRRSRRGFGLIELLVVLAFIAILAAMLSSALSKARAKAKQTTCLNDLRQMGLSITMYAQDTGFNPGFAWGTYYVWLPRIFSDMGNDRKAFWCPSANPNTAWDTNLNPTLVPVTSPLNGLRDPYAVTANTLFSYGYNHRGIMGADGGLELGGDISSWLYVKQSAVVRPTEMIALGDSTPGGSPPWDGTTDPANPFEWPSNRHEHRTVVNFADGHSQAVRRTILIDPANDLWRRCRNNDNQPHNEISWTVD